MYSQGFTFDGRHSSDFGIESVRTNSDFFFEKPIIGDATLTEVQHPFDSRPYLYRTSRTPIEFTLQLVLVNSVGFATEWTQDMERLVYTWLFHDTYKEFSFDNEPDLIYYVMATSDIKLYTNNDKGYLQVHFKSNSPYAWERGVSIDITGNGDTSTLTSIYLNNAMAFKRVFINVKLERRIGETSGNPLRVYRVDNVSPEKIIALQANLIPSVNTIYINGRNKTIIDGTNSLYRYRADLPDTEFPYLMRGTNTLSTPRGWNATVTYQIPVFR